MAESELVSSSTDGARLLGMIPGSLVAASSRHAVTYDVWLFLVSM